MSPERYQRFAAFALMSLLLIVITGVSVRLTESGLGCSDWPTCEHDQLVPEWKLHPMIEFVNRLITGLVSLAVAVAVLGAYLRAPRRNDLIWLATGLVLGVIAQILLGALVVTSHLNAWLVMAHFLLAMAMVANAVVLHCRASRYTDQDATAEQDAEVNRDARLAETALPGAVAPHDSLAASDPGSRRSQRRQTYRWPITLLASLTIVLGAIAAGAGPHTGSDKDEPIERIGVGITDAVRAHSISGLLLLVVVFATIRQLRLKGAGPQAQHRARMLLVVIAFQISVGYVQYFAGIPALLVGFHIATACVVWVTVLWFHLDFTPNRFSPKGAIATRSGPDPNPIRSIQDGPAVSM